MTGDCSTSLPCAGTRQCCGAARQGKGLCSPPARRLRFNDNFPCASHARKIFVDRDKRVYIWQLYAHFVVMNFVLCWTLQFHTVLVVNKIYVVSNIAVVWTNMTTEYAWNSLKNLKLEPSYLVSLWLGCVSYIYCIVLCYTNESLVSGTAPP